MKKIPVSTVMKYVDELLATYGQPAKKIPVSTVIKYVDELLASYGQPAKEIPRVPDAYQCLVVDLAP